MHFDSANNKSPVLNLIQHKPLSSPSHTAWKTKAQETINSLHQVLIAGNTVCMTHLHQGIIFGMSNAKNKGKILLMQ
jgi:hypothetical protein